MKGARGNTDEILLLFVAIRIISSSLTKENKLMIEQVILTNSWFLIMKKSINLQ